MTVRRDTRHSETNASRTDWAQIFQIWLHSTEPGLESSREQRRFSVADRKRELCVVASLGTHRGALRVHQDATVHSTILSPGQHLVHEIAAGRSVWLHVVHGELALLSDVLTTGDGAGIYSERTVSLTARADSEILLLNLAGHPLVAPHR
jgi:redox-sensitive bicupin YhaK (pirin superfamily)